jgi:hypothetical protein
MFLRSILYPSMVAFVIGAPMLYNSNWHLQTGNRVQQVGYRTSAPGGFYRGGSFNGSPNQLGQVDSFPGSSQQAPLVGLNGVNVVAPAIQPPIGLTPVAPASIQLPQLANVDANLTQNPTQNLITNLAANQQSMVVANPSVPTVAQLPTATTVPPGMVVSGPIINAPATSSLGLPGLTPDFGATQTFVFPGDANGPDLTAQPTDFLPVTNLAEIIRFDVYPNWVKNRWKRVSTNPGDAGLHGLRVAVVTGTNTWDLHGSLTYYFDVNQRAQRITFRGWTGDSSRLVNLLTSQFGLKAQPTHWAGAYAAQNKRGVPTAGLLMQHPAVITRENPVQQVAMVMELNHPQGSFQLSPSFLNMLRYAVSGQ